MGSDDDELVILIRLLIEDSTNESHWRSFAKHIWPFMYATNYRLLGGSRQQAEDACQEVLVRLALYKPFRNLRDTRAFRGYLSSICRNVATMMASENNRHRNLTSLFRASLTEKEVSVFELKDLIDSIFEDLDEKDRGLVELIYVGLPLRDVAGVLKISYGAAAVRLCRLRTQLRNTLDDKRLKEYPKKKPKAL